ncbi:MAG: carboxypeptidase regulatory-like domain-containing protein [Thermoanaerobaculia bacterium]|nr:carboxypeptidase regulatory-like domain-containing protein [Thermoanaerobaculia bacterium]
MTINALPARLAFALIATVLPALPVSAGIRARVTLSDAPLSNVTVSAIPYESPLDEARRQARDGRDPAVLASVKTGPGGHFDLTVPVPPGKPAPEFRIEIRGAGIVSLRSQTVWSAGESESLGELAVFKGEPFSGVVLDPAGKPVKGARVLAVPGGSGVRFPDGFSTTPVSTSTGEDGTFRLDGLAKDGNSLSVEAAGFCGLSSVSLRPAASNRRFSLAAGRSVVFQIVKSDGKTPAAGALVRTADSPLWREANGDGKVEFSLPKQPKGTLEADLGEAGWAEFRLEKTPAVLEAPLQIRLRPPAGAEGRVVEAETGRAVPRVKLVARSANRVYTVRSGVDGRYKIRPLPPGSYEFVADDPKSVLYTRGVTINPTQMTRADFPLVLGAMVSGRVVDEEGLPVSGAEGRVERFAEANAPAFFRDSSRSRTAVFVSGPDGAFDGKRLASGNGLRVKFTRSGFEPGHSSILSLSPGAAKAGVTVVMRRGLTVTGTVRDTNGQPVPGAELRFQKMAGAVRMGRARFAMPRQTAATLNFTGDADGRFEARGLPAGDYTVAVRHDGFADATIEGMKLVSGEPVKPLDIVLKPGAVISVRVLRKSGEPSEGQRLRVSEAGRDQAFGPARGLFNPVFGPSQPDGSILIEGLEEGKRYDLSLLTRSSSMDKRGVLAPSENVEFILPGTGSIAGRVIDSDERPVAEFEISTSSTPGAGGPGFVFRRPGSGQRFESADGQFQVDDIPAGSWTVTARATSFQDGTARNVVVEEDAVKQGVEIRLQRGVKVTGKVTDARTGRAVPDASVSLRQAEGGGGGPAILAALDGSGAITTDADGRFEADAVAGKYRVDVRHADYAPSTQTVDVTAQGGAVDVKIAKGGVLSGVVLSSDRKPVADAEVFLRESGDSPGRGGFGVGGNTTGTDASGQFRFENLSASRYQLTASMRESSSEPVDVVLEAGASRQNVVLTLATGATIRGVVTGLPESQRKDVQITASGATGFMESTFTGAEGTFEIRGAPEGVVQIRANVSATSGGRRSSTHVTVAAGQSEVTAEIMFQGQSAISGRVLRNGQGVSGAFVSASMPVGGRSSGGTSRTDDQGSYRIEGLEDGDWTVSVNLPGSGGGKQEKVRVSGETQRDITLPALRVSGEVVESGTRRPLANVSVTGLLVAFGMETPGRMPPRTQTDSSGKFALEGLDSGRYTLRAERAGYQTATRDIDVSADVADGITIEMTRGQGLEFVVRDGIYNLPLRGVVLRAEDPATKASYTGQVSLDQDGRGEVSSLRPGTYKIWLGSSGYAPATGTVTVPGPAVELRLTPGGRIRVTVGPKTSALQNQRYKLLLPSGEAFPSVYGPPAGGADSWRPLLNGLELANLPPGPYAFVVDGGETRSISVPEGGLTLVELP